MELFNWGKSRSSRPNKGITHKKKQSNKPINKSKKQIKAPIASVKEPVNQAVTSAIIEKLRINKTLELVKAEKLNDEIQLINKQIIQKQFLSSKLSKLRSEISSNCEKLRKSIDSLHSQRELEKTHIKDLLSVNKTVNHLDLSIKSVSSSRKGLLSQEEKLIADLDNFLRKNKNTLNYDGKSLVLPILTHKKQLLTETGNLVNEQMSIIFADKKAMQEIIRRQRNMIAKLDHSIHERVSTLNSMNKEYAIVSTKKKSFDIQLKKLIARRNKLNKVLE